MIIWKSASIQNSVRQNWQQLHEILKKSGYEERYREIIVDRNMYQDVISSFPRTRKLAILPDDFYREYEAVFGELYPQLPRQLIHRDPNYNNLILEQGRCTGLLHFELSECNVRIFDLCYAATAVLSEMYMQEDEREDWFTIFHHIVDGYEQETPLTQEEKMALKYVVFSIQHICVDYFAKYDKYVRQYESNCKMLGWLWENRERF